MPVTPRLRLQSRVLNGLNPQPNQPAKWQLDFSNQRFHIAQTRDDSSMRFLPNDTDDELRDFGSMGPPVLPGGPVAVADAEWRTPVLDKYKGQEWCTYNYKQKWPQTQDLKTLYDATDLKQAQAHCILETGVIVTCKGVQTDTLKMFQDKKFAQEMDEKFANKFKKFELALSSLKIMKPSGFNKIIQQTGLVRLTELLLKEHGGSKNQNGGRPKRTKRTVSPKRKKPNTGPAALQAVPPPKKQAMDPAAATLTTNPTRHPQLWSQILFLKSHIDAMSVPPATVLSWLSDSYASSGSPTVDVNSVQASHASAYSSSSSSSSSSSAPYSSADSMLPISSVEEMQQAFGW